MMASEDCVLSFRTSGPNYRTKQMASGDARDPWVTGQQIGTQSLNSLTAKCVPAGTKNSRSEDFLLAKHTSHKHPHHDVPFSRLAAWFP